MTVEAEEQGQQARKQRIRNLAPPAAACSCCLLLLPAPALLKVPRSLSLVPSQLEQLVVRCSRACRSCCGQSRCRHGAWSSPRERRRWRRRQPQQLQQQQEEEQQQQQEEEEEARQQQQEEVVVVEITAVETRHLAGSRSEA